MLAELLDCLPPPRRTEFNHRPVHSGFSRVVIVPYDAAGGRVFSEISCSPCLFIQVHHHTHNTSTSSVLKTSVARFVAGPDTNENTIGALASGRPLKKDHKRGAPGTATADTWTHNHPSHLSLARPSGGHFGTALEDFDACCLVYDAWHFRRPTSSGAFEAASSLASIVVASASTIQLPKAPVLPARPDEILTCLTTIGYASVTSAEPPFPSPPLPPSDTPYSPPYSHPPHARLDETSTVSAQKGRHKLRAEPFLVPASLSNLLRGAAVAVRLACSPPPPPKANRLQYPCRVTPGIVPDDAAVRQVFSGIPRFPHPPFIRVLPHTYLNRHHRRLRGMVHENPRRLDGCLVRHRVILASSALKHMRRGKIESFLRRVFGKMKRSGNSLADAALGGIDVTERTLAWIVYGLTTLLLMVCVRVEETGDPRENCRPAASYGTIPTSGNQGMTRWVSNVEVLVYGVEAETRKTRTGLVVAKRACELVSPVSLTRFWVLQARNGSRYRSHNGSSFTEVGTYRGAEDILPCYRLYRRRAGSGDPSSSRDGPAPCHLGAAVCGF
ncbi:hypothetical protein PR048_025356 [Dryococelus australis]|uniref:Uncharacterized protein n=1 Tax=Dryococelus australis TaxID=614101 RepID=A0ABQ9GR46_9NEOP|nr:hypothetical protein PR048_025356 [Dryococelus australis]